MTAFAVLLASVCFGYTGFYVSLVCLLTFALVRKQALLR